MNIILPIIGAIAVVIATIGWAFWFVQREKEPHSVAAHSFDGCIGGLLVLELLIGGGGLFVWILLQ